VIGGSPELLGSAGKQNIRFGAVGLFGGGGDVEAGYLGCEKGNVPVRGVIGLLLCPKAPLCSSRILEGFQKGSTKYPPNDISKLLERFCTYSTTSMLDGILLGAYWIFIQADVSFLRNKNLNVGAHHVERLQDRLLDLDLLSPIFCGRSVFVFRFIRASVPFPCNPLDQY
jgi:hypothetical protein